MAILMYWKFSFPLSLKYLVIEVRLNVFFFYISTVVELYTQGRNIMNYLA